ncbi:3-phosphoshikimate 1-carboxyvinyltransferase [Oxyplasma meridianum]|uniref:3-phosphoshikimate 1-carboxyvinyltransferase n=1 Tax=Oxyplasma meridianum TaxID=3073602 RepID=A0AAX4NHA1_9ARCH
MRILGRGPDISGTVSVPSSKSFSQRCILYAGFSETEARIGPLAFSNDENIAIDIIRNCGLNLVISGRYIEISGKFSCPPLINVGESGTSYRISLGLLAAKGCRTEITGNALLAARPIRPLVESLERCGARFEFKLDGFPVIDSEGANIENCAIDGSLSSQYVTSVVMASSLKADRSHIHVLGKSVSPDYLKITEETLDQFGVIARRDGDYYTVTRKPKSEKLYIEIEGDFSSAAVMLVLGVIGSDGGIIVRGLNRKSTQGDSVIVKILSDAGSMISWESDQDGDYIICRKSELKKITVDADLYPDLAIGLSILGIFSSGGVEIKNPGRLRQKESDRLDAIVRMAQRYGSHILLSDDSLEIRPGKEIKPLNITVESKDHRIIMAEVCAMILSGSTGSIKFHHEVSKSFPDFFWELEKLSVDIKP